MDFFFPAYIFPTSFFNAYSYCTPLMILTKVPQLLTMKSTSAEGYLEEESKDLQLYIHNLATHNRGETNMNEGTAAVTDRL